MGTTIAGVTAEMVANTPMMLYFSAILRHWPEMEEKYMP